MKHPSSIPLLAVLFTAISSCSTFSPPDSRSNPPAGANPLVGTWTFDYQGSVVHNAVYAANAGLSDAQQARSGKFIEWMKGSSVTFTADTITTKSGQETTSMDYKVKSLDADGNMVIANDAGIQANYSVTGNTLTNTVPEYRFVAVYKKRQPTE